MRRGAKDCSDGGTNANTPRASHPSWKMIRSYAQIAPTVAARCNSAAQGAPSPRFLSPPLRVAPPATPVDTPPKNRCPAGPRDRRAAPAATIAGTRRRFAPLPDRPQPAVSGGTKLSKSSVCAFSSGPTTTFHPVPRWRFPSLAGLASRALRLIWGELPLFFIQPIVVARETPKVRVKPRQLPRSS